MCRLSMFDARKPPRGRTRSLHRRVRAIIFVSASWHHILIFLPTHQTKQHKSMKTLRRTHSKIYTTTNLNETTLHNDVANKNGFDERPHLFKKFLKPMFSWLRRFPYTISISKLVLQSNIIPIFENFWP